MGREFASIRSFYLSSASIRTIKWQVFTDVLSVPSRFHLDNNGQVRELSKNGKVKKVPFVHDDTWVGSITCPTSIFTAVVVLYGNKNRAMIDVPSPSLESELNLARRQKSQVMMIKRTQSWTPTNLPQISDKVRKQIHFLEFS